MRDLFYPLLCIAILASPAIAGEVDPPEGPGENHTPSLDYAWSLKPWLFDLGDRPEFEIATFNGQYVLAVSESPQSPGLEPDIDIEECFYLFDSNAGLGFMHGHGGSAGIGLEVREFSAQGRQATIDAWEYYEQYEYPGELYWGWSASVTGYFIGPYWSSVSARSSFDNGVCHIQCCCGNVCPLLPGVRLQFGAHCLCSYENSIANVRELWGGANGDYGWERRTLSWSHQYCPALDMMEGVADGRKTVLNPCVKWCSVPCWKQIPRWGKWIRLMFDAHMDTSGDPEVTIRAWWENPSTDPTLEVDQVRWVAGSDTTVEFHVRPTGVEGPSLMVLTPEDYPSATHGEILLDGDAKDGPSEWCMGLKNGDDPAAAAHIVSYKDGVVTFLVDSELHTDHYRIEGRKHHSPWDVAVDNIPSGCGLREIVVANNYTEVRLIEVETQRTCNYEVAHGIAQPSTGSPFVAPPHRTYDEVMAALPQLVQRAVEAEARYGRDRFPGEGESVVVYAPAAYIPPLLELETYLNTHDVALYFEEMEQFGPPEQAYEALKAHINAMAGGGLFYFWLVGDSNDGLEIFAESAPHHDEYWDHYDWPDVWQAYIAGSGYPPAGEPQYNIMPLKYEHDELPRGENMSWHFPYNATWDDLADTDGDSIPDVVVSYLPASDPLHVAVYVDKLIQYYTDGGWDPHAVIASYYVDDVEYDDPGDHLIALDIASSVAEVFPPGTIVRYLLASYYGGDYITPAISHYGTAGDMHFFFGPCSNRIAWANWFRKPGFHIDMMPDDTWPGPCFGITCGVCDTWRTQNPYTGTPLVQDFLFADGFKGSVCVVGPSAGTWAEGNREIGIQIAQRVATTPNKSIALALLEGKQYVYSMDPELHSDAIKVARIYSCAGFPLVSVLERAGQTHIDDDLYEACEWKLNLNQSTPNPFTVSTNIGFCIEAPGYAQVNIYNIYGRLVRTLLDGLVVEGQHNVLWDGRNNAGDHVSSGVYWYGVCSRGRMKSRTMHLVR